MGDPAMETSLVRPTRLPYRVLYALLFGCVLFFIIILLPGRLHCCHNSPQSTSTSPVLLLQETSSTTLYAYNATYPLTSPRRKCQLYESARKGDSGTYPEAAVGLSVYCGINTPLPQPDERACLYRECMAVMITFPTTDTSEGVEYHIGLVADRDERSRVGGECACSLCCSSCEDVTDCRVIHME